MLQRIPAARPNPHPCLWTDGVGFEMTNQGLLFRSLTRLRPWFIRWIIDGAVFQHEGIGSTQVRHQLGDFWHRVRLPFGDGFCTRVEPAFCCAVGFHLFGNRFPVVDFGLIHGNDKTLRILEVFRHVRELYMS